MCGIAGISNNINYKSISAVKEMIGKISHRGPDDQGLLDEAHHSLGHVRLSILDLEGGRQPMSTSQHDNHIVFNGEIYNYRELRNKLPQAAFSTNSDTEVLLHLGASDTAPAKWVKKLDGMFAFAIASDTNLTLARDPLGIKPLYLGTRGKSMVFASEIKAILDTADDFAEFPPGHIYSQASGFQRYYRLMSSPELNDDLQTAQANVRTKLEEAVRKRLLADVPLGVFLSGGLDSSIIAALAARHKQPLDTFSVGMHDSPDRTHAKSAAQFLQTRHHEYVYTLDEALDLLPEIIYSLESFDCALVRSAVPNYFLTRLASQHVKVALSGEGADELFAGYSYLKNIHSENLHNELLHITNALHNTNLQRCDRLSMLHGLEVRVPFLDIDLVDYAFQLPLRYKLNRTHLTEKWILRRIAADLLPEEIAWRKKAKFAIGSGLADKLADFAEKEISDAEFNREKDITEDISLRSKEELFYYRIFKSQFPAEKVLPLIGRSRSV